MKLIKKQAMRKTSAKKIREIVTRENKFILDLFAAVALPTKVQFEGTVFTSFRLTSLFHNIGHVNNSCLMCIVRILSMLLFKLRNSILIYVTDEEHVFGKRSKPSENPRATSLSELQNRLEKVKVRNASYKEKVQKKQLKNKLRKKLNKQSGKTGTKKNKEFVKKQSSQITNDGTNPVKLEKVKSEPVFNQDNKLMFSKIDFTGFGKHEQKKGESNPKRVLEKVQELEDKISKLKSSGQTEMAAKIAERTAWKNALAKSQGKRVKDDPVLLKKSIKKLEQKKKASKKKWESRLSFVEKSKKEKQLKREKNLEKRKKEKKVKKLKAASKRGKIIPGF